MNPQAEQKIRNLTQRQAKVLKTIMFPNNSALGSVIPGSYISLETGLRENSLGGTVSALERNNIISPLGRENRQYNWELADPDLKQAKQEDPETLMDMLNRITGVENK